MPKKTYGLDHSGKPITDELTDGASKKAEQGCGIEETPGRRGGRPPIGSTPASVESVRLDPELSEALRDRAERDGRTNSDIIREALRRYLKLS